MNYKRIGIRVHELLFSPKLAWEKISSEQDEHRMHPVNEFALPMIALASLCALLNELINKDGYNMNIAVKEAGVLFASFYMGLFVSAYLLKRIAPILLKQDYSLFLCLQLLAYSSFFIYISETITQLLPALFFVKVIGCLLVIYPIYYGVKILCKLEEKQAVTLVLIATFLSLFIPFLIEFILSKQLLKYVHL